MRRVADSVLQRQRGLDTLARWEECWYNRFPALGGVRASLAYTGLQRPNRAALDELGHVGRIVDEMLREEPDCEDIPPPDPDALDVYFVLDVSESMSQEFEGEDGVTKYEAAVAAITEGLNLLESYDNGSRAALLTYSGGVVPAGIPPSYATFLDYWGSPSDDFAFLIDVLNFSVGPSGSTPTAHALHLIEDEIAFDQGIDPTRKPVIILITDGVATISYGDAANPARGYSFLDEDVQAVPVSNGMGGFHPIATVRASGAFYSLVGYFAGEPLADVMEAAIDVMAIPNLTMHGIALDGFFFNAGIVEYVAFTGAGLYAAPLSLQEAIDAVIAAIEESS